ncbi:MAG: T9SS type A sorting domain-containing protein [Candidatus Electryonea clarkiae]|nr:T9SS type A sorting domain-containing protein [Candidatus Electryonea clarkiae]MDP8288316.1 T9SS type A sorting domain-containing protein [Candidatus Electryonea clarkiae]
MTHERFTLRTSPAKGDNRWDGGGAGPDELDDAGGPDELGYIWRDSNEDEGPEYNWQDILAIGVRSDISDDDDATIFITLPWVFNYYGTAYTNVWISTNGNVHFGDTERDSGNSPIPNDLGPPAIIAPLWDDLNPATGGTIYYHGNENRFIVQWNAVRRFNDIVSRLTFQLILYPDDRILFQYNSVDGNLSSCTVGIENQEETVGLQVVYNTNYLENDLAVEFYPPPSAFSLASPDSLEVSPIADVLLTWFQSFDPDPHDSIDYSIFVSTDPDNLGDPIATNMDHEDTTHLFTGDDDSTYYWTIHAMDNTSNIGTWADQVWPFDIYIPEPPTTFDLLEPMDATLIGTLTPTMIWEAAPDPDPGDTITYTIYYSIDDANFNNPDSVTGVEETTYEFPEGVIPDDETIYWYVRAEDSFGNSVLSSRNPFDNFAFSFESFRPDPPLPFSLLSPQDRSFTFDGDTTLVWESTSDDDPGDGIVGYHVWWSTDPDFGFDVDSAFVADTTFELVALEHAQSYWWKVRAQDNNTEGTWSDETWRVHAFFPVAPGQFNLVYAEDDTLIHEDFIGLAWTEPEDPNLDNGLQVHGPDNFGYYWISSNEPGGAEYDWVEISGTGTRSTTSDNANSTETVDLPWQFSYYGNQYNSVTISSNGNIHFGTPNSDFTNSNIPAFDGPAAMIAPFWDALQPNLQGDIYYRDAGDQFIVQWDGVRRFGDPTSVYTFEVILHEEGFIVFQYNSLTGTLNSCTAGIENHNENDGLQVIFDEEYLDNELSISFFPQTILYTVAWADNPFFNNALTENTLDTTFILSGLDGQGLPDDQRTYWQIVATNVFQQNTVATPFQGRSFTVYIYDPPNDFNLLLPADEAVSSVEDVTLTWAEAIDPDPGDEVTYDVYVSTNEGNLGNAIATGLTVRNYTFAGEDDTEYWWTIKANDTNTNGTWASSTNSFLIYTPEPPDDFNLTAPDSGSVSASSSVTLSWNAPTDPDPDDIITYEVYVSTDQGDLGLPVASDVTSTNYIFDASDDTQYWWRILAVDSFDSSKWSDDLWSFSVYVADPPNSFDLASPADESIMTDSDVTLAWRPADDPDPGDNIVYSVYVSTDEGDLGTPVVTGLTDTTYTYTGSDDTQYWWTVRAVDTNSPSGTLANQTWSFSIAVPDPPDPFDLVFPADGSEESSTEVNLSWQTATDPDPGDNVTYEIYVSTDSGDMGEPVASDVTSTNYTFNGIDNTEYWWTIKAIDTNTNGTWASETFSFEINVANSPNPFSLLTPADSSVFEITNVTLTWESTTDDDPDDIITFDVYISTDELDLGNAIATGLTGTSYDFTGSDNNIYFWRIRALDLNTPGTWSTEQWSFAIDIPQPPSSFGLLLPDDGSSPVGTDVVLTWEASIDPDPTDTLTYDLYVSTDQGNLGNPVATNLTDTTYTFDGTDDTQYWWTVKAVDRNTTGTFADETWDFTLFIPEPPNSFNLSSPADSFISTSTNVTLSWEDASDPDPGDDVSYEIYVTTDSDNLGSPVAEDITGTSITFNGLDNTEYWWTIRAVDQFDSSTWADETRMFTIIVPDPPGSFNLTSVADNATSTTLQVNLEWEPAVETDLGDSVVYDVYVSTDIGDLGNPVAQDLTDTTYTFIGTDDTQYWWTVKAIDTNTSGTFADETWSFRIAVPEPPNSFSLLEPADSFISVDYDVLLIWQPSIDPDPGDNVTFDIYVSTDQDNPGNPVATGVTNTNYTFTGLDDTEYFWSVKAIDGNTNGTWADEQWSFELDVSDPPGAFSLTAPDNGTISEVSVMLLSWEESIDPDDGELVSYDVYVSTDPDDLGSPVAVSLTSTNYLYSGNDDTQYFWSIKAKDPWLLETWADETWNWSIAIPEEPDTFSLTSPPHNTVLDQSSVVLTWVAPVDPDPGDEISYDVYVSTDSLNFGDPVVTGVSFNTYTFAGEDDSQYWWTVKAIDTNTDGTLANDTLSFILYIPETPGSFDLAAPADGFISSTNGVSLTWNSTTDPDPGDSIRYSVYVSEDELVLGDPVAENLSDTTYTFVGRDDTEYFWNVRAVDTNTGGTLANTTWSFSIAIPELPTDFTLASPDSSDTMTVSTDITLSWMRSFDFDPDDTLTYEVYISTDQDDLSIPVATGIADSSYTFNGSDDTVYWWRIKAVDTNTEGTWSNGHYSFRIQVPESPDSFNLISPVADYISFSADVVLTWELTTDSDPGDDVVFDLYVSTDPDDLGNPIATGLTDTSYTFSGSDNTHYYWTVKAIDDNTNGIWADESRDFTIIIPEPPSSFALVSPINGTVSGTEQVTLSWGTSTDPDPGDAVTYNIYISNDAAQLDTPLVTGISSNSFIYNGNDNDPLFYWTIKAVDLNSGGTWADDTLSFSIYIAEPPSAFDLLTPADSSTIAASPFTLTWEQSNDPDPDDAVTYTLEYSLTNDFLSPATITGLATESYSITNALDDTTLFWRVHAEDNNTNGTWSGPDAYWMLNIAIEEPPNSFSLESPNNGGYSNLNGSVDLRWENNGDPDQGQSVTYWVHVSETSEFTSEVILGPYDEGEFPTLFEFWMEDDHSYYWKVMAEDAALDTSIRSSEIWRFYIHVPQMPIAFGLSQPTDNDTSFDGSVSFEWENSGDPDPMQEVTYTLHVTEDINFAQNHVYGPFSEDEFITLDEGWMVDDHRYWWTVWAHDEEYTDSLLSDDIRTFLIYIPENPQTFELVSPVDSEQLESLTPALTWRSTSDPDPNDSLSYTLEWSLDSAFSNSTFITDLTDTSYTFAEEVLNDDVTIYWHVKAVDQNTGGTWSGPDTSWSFSIAIQDPPNPFGLISPVNNDTSFDGSMTFHWQRAGDPDPDQSVEYTIHIAEDNNFTNNHIFGPYSSGELMPVISDQVWMVDDSLYWWKMFALDEITDDSVESNQSRIFQIYIPQPPLIFSKTSPIDNAIVNSYSPTLVWESTIDPDPDDTITYDLEWSFYENLHRSITVTGLADTFYIFEEEVMLGELDDLGGELDDLLPDDVRIFWRIHANDSNSDGVYAGPQEVWSFSVSVPDPPNAFELMMPEDEAVEDDSLVTLAWNHSIDPDTGSALLYDVYVSRGGEPFRLKARNFPDTTYIFNANRDDEDWAWTVRVHDETGYYTMSQDTFAFSTYFPEIPARFSPLTPLRGAIVDQRIAHLTWEEAFDPDPEDVVTYFIEIIQVEDSVMYITEHLANPEYYFEIPADDREYRWRVQARDSNTNGRWISANWNFTARIPDPPEQFDLASPVNAALLDSINPVLTWHPSGDPDPGDLITYSLIWSINDPDFDSPDSVTGIVDTFYAFTLDEIFTGAGSQNKTGKRPEESKISGHLLNQITENSNSTKSKSEIGFNKPEPNNPNSNSLDELPYDAVVYWYVRAVDTNTDGVLSSENPVEGDARRFMIYVEDEPSAFNLISPPEYGIIDTSEVLLTWESSTDPDQGDEITYDLYIATGPRNLFDPYETGLTDTFYTFTGNDDITYYWFVTASDPQENEVFSDEDWQFTIRIAENPLPFKLAGPSNDTLLITDQPVLRWGKASDPDPDDALTYTLYWSENRWFTPNYPVSGLIDTFFVWSGEAPALQTGSKPGMRGTVIPAKAGIHKESSIVPLNILDSRLRGNDTSISGSELDDNENITRIFWKIKAVDTNTDGMFASGGDAWSFSMYSYEAPRAFELIFPGSSDTIGESNITFTWQSAHDEISRDSVEYLFEISTDPGFINSVAQITGSDTTTEISDLLDNQYYWWRVKATDTFDRVTNSENVFVFQTYMPDPPTSFNMIEPVDSLRIPWQIPHRNMFSWQVSDDPDPADDSVTYNVHFEVSINDSTIEVLDYDSLTSTLHWINIPDSLELTMWMRAIKVAWQVDAVSNGDTISSDSTRIFWLERPDIESPWENTIPEKFEIAGIYPNPFNSMITIVVALPEAVLINVEIFDILGRRITKFQPPTLEAGYHRIPWKAGNLAAGIYFTRVSTEQKTAAIRKIVLVK